MGDNVFVKSLFENVEGFEDAQEQFIDLNKTYIREDKRAKKKKKEFSEYLKKWKEIREINIKLANYFPLPLFNEEIFMAKDYFDYGIVRIWVQKYKAGEYMHEGKIYEGEEFKFIEAEIKGTEDFDIEDKLFLHQKLLMWLQNGGKLEDITKEIKQDIQALKNGFRLCDLQRV